LSYVLSSPRDDFETNAVEDVEAFEQLYNMLVDTNDDVGSKAHTSLPPPPPPLFTATATATERRVPPTTWTAPMPLHLPFGGQPYVPGSLPGLPVPQLASSVISTTTTTTQNSTRDLAKQRRAYRRSRLRAKKLVSKRLPNRRTEERRQIAQGRTRKNGRFEPEKKFVSITDWQSVDHGSSSLKSTGCA